MCGIFFSCNWVQWVRPVYMTTQDIKGWCNILITSAFFVLLFVFAAIILAFGILSTDAYPSLFSYLEPVLRVLELLELVLSVLGGILMYVVNVEVVVGCNMVDSYNTNM